MTTPTPTSPRACGPEFLLSIVAPVYNEVEGIEGFVREVREHAAALDSEGRAELVLVNDDHRLKNSMAAIGRSRKSSKSSSRFSIQ